MRILLIGNFAPPYEEESLQNLSLLKKLEEDGHECRVINISKKPSNYKNFLDSENYISFVFTLLRSCWRKDIVHFATKGYLRLGLLKLMTSILVGKFFRAKTFITIHSEFFSVAGRMRSPVGGRQTVFTSFTLADRIFCSDKDTYDVVSMYIKKNNYELIPSFIYAPGEIRGGESSTLKKLGSKEKVIIFANVKDPSFLLEILKELLSNYPLPPDAAIVISLADKPTSKFQRVLEEIGNRMLEDIIFIEPDDLRSTLTAYSKADTILRTMSCDGSFLFENFAISVKKIIHLQDFIYFPRGFLFITEGAAEMCVSMMNKMLYWEACAEPEPKMKNSYDRILQIYKE